MRARLVVVAALLAACSTQFVPDPVPPLGRPEARIGVLPVDYPAEPGLAVIADPDAPTPAASAPGEDAFRAALRAADYDYRPRVHTLLLLALRDAGVRATRIDAPPAGPAAAAPPASGVFRTGYEGPWPTDVDLLLDLQVAFVGYASAGDGEPFEPTLQFLYRLVDAESGAILGTNRVIHGGAEGAAGIVLPAAPGYAFDGFGAIMADVPRARNGLDRAIIGATEALAARLATVLEP